MAKERTIGSTVTYQGQRYYVLGFIGDDELWVCKNPNSTPFKIKDPRVKNSGGAFQNGRQKALQRLANAGQRYVVKAGSKNESWFVFDKELNQNASYITYPKEQDALDAAFRLNQREDNK